MKNLLYEDFKGYERMKLNEFNHPLKNLFLNLDIKEPILDVGCGSGNILELFNSKENLGIEPSKLAVELCLMKGLRVILIDLQTFNIKQKFKSIFCIGLIGSVENPEMFINKMKSFLDTDGKIYITFAKKRKEDDDTKEFSIKKMNEILDKNGLIAEKYIGLNRIRILALCSNVLLISKLK